MTDGIAAFIERQGEPYEVSGGAVDEPAIGGTMFGNALSMAATRAALAEVWTPGERDIPAVRHLQRVFMANRGIWEFGWWCGPVVSAQATRDDIDFYLSVFSQFVRDLLG
jgi:hypothetical protein